MAVSGLLLLGFLLSHVGGNALLMAPDNGESYNAYAAGLRNLGPLLWIARCGLATLFAAHIFLGLQVSAENRRARGQRYRMPLASKARSFSSRSMLHTGVIVLAFLAAHLWHFSFDQRFSAEGAGLVRSTLQSWGVLSLYTTGVIALWVHLWHAVPSALHTLGATHPRWSLRLRKASRVTVSAICSLFLAILFVTFVNQ